MHMYAFYVSHGATILVYCKSTSPFARGPYHELIRRQRGRHGVLSVWNIQVRGLRVRTHIACGQNPPPLPFIEKSTMRHRCACICDGDRHELARVQLVTRLDYVCACFQYNVHHNYYTPCRVNMRHISHTTNLKTIRPSSPSLPLCRLFANYTNAASPGTMHQARGQFCTPIRRDKSDRVSPAGVRHSVATKTDV